MVLMFEPTIEQTNDWMLLGTSSDEGETVWRISVFHHNTEHR